MGKRKVTQTKVSRTEWRGDDLILILEEVTAEALLSSALIVEGAAKQNIVKNDQIDTGFMVNSVYTVAPTQSNYDEAESEAMSKAGKFKDVTGRMLPPEPLPNENTALVAVGAEYGIFQELKNSFLFKALENESGTLGAELQKFAKKEGL
jgi:hypothetical protein